MKEFERILKQLQAAENELAPRAADVERMQEFILRANESKLNFLRSLFTSRTGKLALTACALVLFITLPWVSVTLKKNNPAANLEPGIYIGSSSESTSNYVEDKAVAESALLTTRGSSEAPADEDTTTPGDERAQIRDAKLTLYLKNFAEQYKEINNKALEIGGYVLDANTITDGDFSSGKLTLRVPVGQFDSFLSFLRDLGEVQSENISITDRQNELTQSIATIAELDRQIAELSAKSKLTAQEQAELQQLKADKAVQETYKEEIEIATAFSTVELDFTNSQTDIGQLDELKNVFGDLPEALITIALFWSRVLLVIIVIVIASLPVSLPLYFYVRKLRSRKASHPR